MSKAHIKANTVRIFKNRGEIFKLLLLSLLAGASLFACFVTIILTSFDDAVLSMYCSTPRGEKYQAIILNHAKTPLPNQAVKITDLVVGCDNYPYHTFEVTTDANGYFSFITDWRSQTSLQVLHAQCPEFIDYLVPGYYEDSSPASLVLRC